MADPRRWYVDACDREFTSLSAALDWMTEHPLGGALALYAEMLPGDPEPSPEDVTTDADGNPWVWVPVETAEVVVSADAPHWLLGGDDG